MTLVTAQRVRMRSRREWLCLICDGGGLGVGEFSPSLVISLAKTAEQCRRAYLPVTFACGLLTLVLMTNIAHDVCDLAMCRKDTIITW